MNILVITARLPYPLWRGDALRVFYPMKLLSKKHRLTLLAPVSKMPASFAINELSNLFHKIELVKISIFERLPQLAYNLISGEPLQNCLFFHNTLASKALTLLEQDKYDIIYVVLSRIAPIISIIKSKISNAPKIVLDYTDSLAINMERRAHYEMFPLNLLFKDEAYRIEKFERKILDLADIAFISSALDKKRISDSDKLKIIPNGIDLSKFMFTSSGRDPATIVFTGTMWYFPNVNATIWFVKNVWPFIKQKIPEAKFKVVGANPLKKIKKLAKIQDIEVTGFVPSLEEHIHKATVAIAPMQAGSGMQFKILEAMACGTPVVATSLALGGIEAKENEHLLIANTPAEFAEKVIYLINNPDSARTMAKNARNLIEKHYSLEHIVSDIEAAICSC
jgi:sugar transferase (PEP-CTERM/EpsH1 system associated)